MHDFRNEIVKTKVDEEVKLIDVHERDDREGESVQEEIYYLVVVLEI